MHSTVGGSRRAAARLRPVPSRLACAAALMLLMLSATSCAGQGTGPAGAGRATSGAGTSFGPLKLSGLCFSPYVEGSPSRDDTVTEASIARLLDIIAPHTGGVRTFTSLGSGLESARAARQRGLRVAAGCNIESDAAANEAQVNGLIQLCRSGYVDLAVVGEETLYFKFLDEAALLGYMRRVKETGVRVTTSETWGELIGHPSVIQECDVLLANMFPYWENVGIAGALDYLDSCYRKLKKAAGGREIVIETGWPSAGETRGNAVADPENARTYLEEVTRWALAEHVAYYYFEAFDEPWKAGSEGQVGAHWGIWQSDGTLKPSMIGAI